MLFSSVSVLRELNDINILSNIYMNFGEIGNEVPPGT